MPDPWHHYFIFFNQTLVICKSLNLCYCFILEGFPSSVQGTVTLAYSLPVNHYQRHTSGVPTSGYRAMILGTSALLKQELELDSSDPTAVLSLWLWDGLLCSHSYLPLAPLTDQDSMEIWRILEKHSRLWRGHGENHNAG